MNGNFSTFSIPSPFVLSPVEGLREWFFSNLYCMSTIFT
jgi:hypothetical protein